MKIVNPITVEIIRKAEDGDSVRRIAKKTGFAYSAVYKWVKELEAFGVFDLQKEGNKTVVSVNRETVYNKFAELFKALEAEEKDKMFWSFMRKTGLKARFVGSTATVIWTRGGYITGDFYDKVYHLEVLGKDSGSFKKGLKKRRILFGAKEAMPGEGRPFVHIMASGGFKAERVYGLSVVPLKEFVSWCKRLHLEPVLEQLDLMYGLGLNAKYAEVYANV